MTSPLVLSAERTTRAVSEMSLVEQLAALKRLGIWTPEEAARFDAMRNAEYVLVRNDGSERWRCRLCNRQHEHFTWMCVERPFRGLVGGLYAYWVNVGGARIADLSPRQRQTLDVLRPLFGGQRPIPVATGHPDMAAGLVTDRTDVLLGGTLLGSIDPITPTKARLLVSLINARAGQRVLIL